MHRRPDSLRPRRCAGTPFTIAASLALTVGLLGSATAAHAAVVPTATPAPTASATAASASLSATARGELLLKPGEKPQVGTQVKWTITVTNTGTVGFKYVVTNGGDEEVELKPGDKHDFIRIGTLTQADLNNGYTRSPASASYGWTSDGVQVVASFSGRLDLSAPVPTPSPTTPAPTPTTPAPTPTTPAPTPTTPAPVPAGQGALAATARGELLLKPGEKPKVGTQVKWTVTVVNTGDAAVVDIGNTVFGDLLDLEPGQTGELTASTQLTQTDLSNGYTVLDEPLVGTTIKGVGVTAPLSARLTFATPVPTPTPTTPAPTPAPTTPAPTPAPTTPAPTPTTPAPAPTTTPAPVPATPATPTSTPVAPAPAPAPGTPVTPATVMPAASGTTGITGSTTKSPAATEASKRRLAETGSDAAGALSAAGILTALGAIGMLVGRRRRRTRPAIDRTGH
ncbi:LPXTG cell wall anchor domain-containing protein [Rathayibacter festucae]|uniref:LPXTG cell wall anchor domain-containing protein n=1 Tax=Rathayibacter festucae TaxID=110937 RepID=UPI001FB427EF|nr:LPXTG cell wall anchor domain-containing protein [Rathayibacter festucae]MCJ1701733.1 LPXTG cell wall anchor domain-containing protein [Rathayibacter festucae]